MNDIEVSIKQQKFKSKNFNMLLEELSVIEDPRIDRRKLHPLQSILVIYLCAGICNRTGWDEVFDFAKSREGFFKKLLPLPHGIPSADTFSRVIERIHPKILQQVLLAWIQWVRQETTGDERQISLDGKTLKLSHGSSEEQRACHIVNAWSDSQNLVIAQVAVREKSNEIIAMKEIINYIDVEGTVVSIDAMGCQTDLAESIVSKKGDYFFALKANQQNTLTTVKTHFENIKKEAYRATDQYYKSVEKDHGRIEVREYFVAEAPTSLGKKWCQLKTIGTVISTRTIKGKTSTEQRYFITSLCCNAESFARRVRKHWGIENSLHWILDVDFGEDKCRIRSGFAPQNASWFRCLALSLLKNEPTKLSIRRKILMAGDSLSYLIKVLLNSEI
jgi:Transposase